MDRLVYVALAQTVEARAHCLKSGNAGWKVRHEERILALVELHMPRGSGFDNGTSIDLEKSSSERLIFRTSFHHMDEHGSYDGWTEHTVTVKASLTSRFALTVSGRDRNQIKEYIADAFQYALTEVEAPMPHVAPLAPTSVPSDFPVQPLAPGEAAKDRATCGTCGRSWDDGQSTSMTPTPAGRCPFEAFHTAGAL